MRTSLKNEEKLLLVIRHHWLKLAAPFAGWLALTILVLWLSYSIESFSTSVALIVILIAAIYPLWKYFEWVHNIWAVTNFRVIDEGGFFTRYAKESPLDKINNIEYDQSFWGRIFRYGNVDIQTAAEMGETSYQMIHRPKLLKDTITHAQEEYKLRHMSSQAQQLARAIVSNSTIAAPTQGMIADELQKLFDLKEKGVITEEEFLLQKKKLMS